MSSKALDYRPSVREKDAHESCLDLSGMLCVWGGDWCTKDVQCTFIERMDRCVSVSLGLSFISI